MVIIILILYLITYFVPNCNAKKLILFFKTFLMELIDINGPFSYNFMIVTYLSMDLAGM